jgi:hypothetical protein
MLSQNGGHAGHCKALDAVGACSLQAITRFPMLANANGTADRYVISSNEARRSDFPHIGRAIRVN